MTVLYLTKLGPWEADTFVKNIFKASYHKEINYFIILQKFERCSFLFCPLLKHFSGSLPHRKAGLTYRAAGVDIQAGERLVDAIKPMAAATTRAGCTGSLGMFGGIFDCKAAGFKDPLLVSGTDGVGTKLKVGLTLILLMAILANTKRR